MNKVAKIAMQFNVPYFTDMHEMMQNSLDVVSVITENVRISRKTCD